MTALETPGEDGPGSVAVPPVTDLQRLARWRAAGGGWRVVARSPTDVTVALVTCDGLEEMERFVSSDPAFAAYLESGADNES